MAFTIQTDDYEQDRTKTVTHGRTINQNRKNKESVDNPFPKYKKKMKKNLFIPFVGLFILATCAFYYFNQAPSQKLEAKQVPPVLFEAKDFYKNELINTQNLGDFYIINFIV